MMIQAALKILVLTAAIGTAQTPNRGMDTRRPYPPGGKLTMHSHPGEEIPSLDILVPMAQLIIQGAVVSVLPAFSKDPDSESPDVETHSLFSVTKVLSGRLPPESVPFCWSSTEAKRGNGTSR